MLSILRARSSRYRLKSVEPGAIFRRHLHFVAVLLGSGALFASALRSLFHLATTQSIASHTLLAIPVSSYLVYRNRREIFSHRPSGFISVFCSLIAFVCVLWFHEVSKQSASISLQILELVTLWVCA